MSRINLQSEIKNLRAGADKATAAAARLFCLVLTLARMGRMDEAAAVIAAVEGVSKEYPTALSGIWATFMRKTKGIGFVRNADKTAWEISKSGLSPDAPAPADAGTWEPTPKSRAPKSPEAAAKAAKKAAESALSRAVQAAKKAGLNEAQALATFKKMWLEG